MSGFLVCLIVIVGAVLGKPADFECPKDGQFPHPTQCDKYFVCAKGKARETLCPDGLVFNDATRLDVKCDRTFNVDCGERTELQPPKGTNEKCPRQNGVFAHPDPDICDVYYNCIEDIPVEIKCVPGLHFDKTTANCVWPAVADRGNCKTAEEQKKDDSDDFKCPGKTAADTNGQLIQHPKYVHPTDCVKFYLCLNGSEKRQLACEKGEVYNDVSQQCDAPENVEGCEDWYTEDSER